MALTSTTSHHLTLHPPRIKEMRMKVVVREENSGQEVIFFLVLLSHVLLLPL
jgi:hypothetical protein